MMVNFTNKFLVIALALACITGANRAAAQDGTVNTNVLTHDKDGVFNSTASYTFDVSSTYTTPQTGRVKYEVTTEAGKKMRSDSVAVKLGGKGSASYNFDISGLPSGFYKINFMINVTDYDDTTRKAFGIRPEEIRSQYGKPADFDAFWQNAKAELATVNPEFKVTEMPDSSKDKRKVFLVEMKSLGGLTIRGWLTEPITKNKNKKFVVMLALPGYQVDLKPLYGLDPDIAILSLNIRGQGNSRDVINVRKETYITLGVEDKNKYVLKGAIMDCVRAVDFIYTRPELRHDNIIAVGGSLGGFLAVATSGVDNRISFCSAANPILGDVRNLANQVDWPFNDIKRYVNTRPGLTFDKVLNNMDYFDAKNFASAIKCRTLMGMGMVDNIAPPNTVQTIYNGIPADKHLIIFRDLAHEIGKKYVVYEGRWMRDTFALF
ncbi:acetylxylan esterase [Mucilaginibacter flavidus]|uniref:acetylxylan esterase n=1 Tax=Mucilaginibacter flavidus TaxID=2949309 RepID=UPI00209343B5|nr:acetylxylan esterase [Mucilaginibacter flavidus]MCO5950031.1 acetylxylan esterase [Mucilaginibacter flavidus]